MLDKVLTTVKSEPFQRVALQFTGTIATFIVTSAITTLLHKGVDMGIDALMIKMHPTETAE